MAFAIICTTAPFLIGLIVLLMQRKTHVPTALLLHQISKKQFATSLSEISEEKLDALCQLSVKYNLNLHSLEKSKSIANSVTLTFDDGFASIYEKAFPILHTYNFTATLFITTGHLTDAPPHDVYSKNTPRLSAEQIKELHSHGFQIGSHTVTHRALTLLSDVDIEEELRCSRETLEKIIGEPVTTFAFPLGLWNERILDIAKKVGYEQFTIYNYHKKSRNRSEIIPVTAIYPFDSTHDIIEKLIGKKGFSHAFSRSLIIPHFAKGSPLASFSKAYNPLRFFDRFNSLKEKETCYKKQ